MPASAVRTVQEIFREFVLTIPDYQRGYAWERKQIADFLEDLDLLTDDRPHYTGTLILDPSAQASPSEIEDISGNLFRRADVVDGQQRLTTIVILLTAIARALRASGQEALANGVTETFVMSVTREKQPLPKLQLNHDSASYWERNILSEAPGPDPPSIVSDSRLLAARSQVETYLGDGAGSRPSHERVAWLNRLREKVVKQLRLTVYEVDDTAEVGIIFETQNDRGRPLTDLEKTKNLLLYLAAKLAVPGHDLASLVNDTWTKVLRSLSDRNLVRSADEDTLLRCHWLIFHDPRPREWHGFESVRGTFSLRRYKDNQPELANKIRKYLRTLGDCITPFCDVMAPNHSAAFASWSDQPKLHHQVVDYSRKLQRIRAVANLVPLLVSCRLRGDFSPQDYLRILKRAELYAFRSRVARSRADAGQGTLFPLAHRVQHNEADIAEVVDGLAYVTSTFGGAGTVRFMLTSVENWFTWPHLKYVLFEYELRRAGPTHPAQVSWTHVEGGSAKQTIEHILPQTPTDPYWQERFDDAALQKWTDDLGNLCLTYDNSSYRNKSFPNKKGTYGQERMCYANSPLYQEKDLCDYADWTPASVEERRQQLLDFIWDRWAVEAVDLPKLAAAAAILPPDAGDEDLTMDDHVPSDLP
jgi:hypothetical protein